MYIKIEVTAGAKSETVEKVAPDLFRISVREKAERNMANRRVLELVRREFGRTPPKPSATERGRGVLAKIISGHHSPHKIVSIDIVNMR